MTFHDIMTSVQHVEMRSTAISTNIAELEWHIPWYSDCAEGFTTFAIIPERKQIVNEESRVCTAFSTAQKQAHESTCRLHGAWNGG